MFNNGGGDPRRTGRGGSGDLDGGKGEIWMEKRVFGWGSEVYLRFLISVFSINIILIGKQVSGILGQP